MSKGSKTQTVRKAHPVLERATDADFAFQGVVGDRISANLRNWLLTAPAANPTMIQMFYDRDRTPPRVLMPWAGEFAGKYLISAVQALRMTRDTDLRSMLDTFVTDLVGAQDQDGYLGPWPRHKRLFGEPNARIWDLWGHYHCMLGLYLWHKETGDQAAFAACRRAADLFCTTFLDGDKRVADAECEEMNESAIHVFTLLYQETREPRYLQMAREIEADWQKPPSGDYVRTALDGLPFWKTPKPRWESLHSIQAVAELYFITGDDNYRRAFEHIWWSMLEGDRHNTGGFSSGEAATGDPYSPAAIETCCVIAWMALTQDMLRMTGDSRAADEIELSTFNSVLGAQNWTGRWWTYNTPMDGERTASAHAIVFQAAAGSSELNCCSVNGPRGLGILSEWAVMTSDEGIVVNYYGPSEFTIRTSDGHSVKLAQKTDYPVGGNIELAVTPEIAKAFTLRLRIPSWSRNTRVTLNCKEVDHVRTGTYLALNRMWKTGDSIDLELDMSPRLWIGERGCEGKVSIYCGPILLAYDPRFDVYDPTNPPSLDLACQPSKPGGWNRSPQPMLLLRFATVDGKEITLCDFASAGACGNVYCSWLPANGFEPAAFDRSNPLRAVWP